VPIAPVESATVNPVGTPFLSSPGKEKLVAFALTAEPLNFVAADALAEGDVEGLTVAKTYEFLEIFFGEIISSKRIFGIPVSVGIELKPRNAKKTKIRDSAALLDFLATSAALL